MPTPVDALFFVVIVAGLAARAWFGMRTLRSLPPDRLAAMRPRMWARAIFTQWGLVAALVAWWFLRQRPFGWLGLSLHAGWGLGGVLVGAALMIVMLRSQRRQVSANHELRERVRERLTNVSALLPGDRAEWPGFASLAITAGICEEVLFRGFVTWWLAHFVPAFWMAAVLQGLLFGLAHAYQGARGILSTGAVGLFMAGIVWVTGSLWAAMLLHALMDLHAGDLALRVLEADAPAAATGA